MSLEKSLKKFLFTSSITRVLLENYICDKYNCIWLLGEKKSEDPNIWTHVIITGEKYNKRFIAILDSYGNIMYYIGSIGNKIIEYNSPPLFKDYIKILIKSTKRNINIIKYNEKIKWEEFIDNPFFPIEKYINRSQESLVI